MHKKLISLAQLFLPKPRHIALPQLLAYFLRDAKYAERLAGQSNN